MLGGEVFRQLFGDPLPPSPAEQRETDRRVQVYRSALVELAHLGDPEAPAYARIARRALREGGELATEVPQR
jgi:hypothetical protein